MSPQHCPPRPAFPLPKAILDVPRASGSRAKNTACEPVGKLPWAISVAGAASGPCVFPGLGHGAPRGPYQSLLPISETLVPDRRASGFPGGQQSLEVTSPAGTPLPRSQCRLPWDQQLPLCGRPGPARPA